MKLKDILSYVCISVLLLSSCRIEKRLYRKGYHVVWNHHNSEQSKPKTDLNKIETVETAMASAEKEIIPVKPSPVLIFKDTCGDKLLLQNADELLVKVIEISDDQIKYKRCDNADGPTYSISKKKVALITYANGVKEVIMPEPKQPTANSSNEMPERRPAVDPKVNPTGLTSLLLYIGAAILSRGLTASVTTGLGLALLVGVGGLLALILAYVALFQFKNEPGRYSGRWMPLTVVGINIAGLLIVALALALAASLYGGGLGIVAVVCLLLAALLIGILISALAPRRPDPSKERK